MTVSDGEQFFNSGVVDSASNAGGSSGLIGGTVGPEGLPEMGLVGSGKANGNRVLTQGTALILVVFVIAGVTLYGMRLGQRSAPPSASTVSAEAKIDQALQKLSMHGVSGQNDQSGGETFDGSLQDTERIVLMFLDDPTQRQVPTEFVKKNPFILPVFQEVATPGDDSRDTTDRNKKQIQSDLRREFERLELQSIMRGHRPMAIISGRVVMPGQTVGSFTVKVVRDLVVELVCDGETFQLRMPRPQDEQNGIPLGRRR